MPPDPLAVTALGLAVFGLPPGSKRAAPGWHSRCTADPAAVAAGWRPGDNVGVGCRISGIVGVDLDRYDGGPDGRETFAALCARARAPWPPTLTVRTAHGGLHLYFRAPAGVPVASAIARWPGVDIRGPGYRLGGYLAGPGSVVDGQPYLIERDAPMRDLPGWLAAMLRAFLDVLRAVLGYVAAQIGVTDPSCVKRYTERDKTRLSISGRSPGCTAARRAVGPSFGQGGGMLPPDDGGIPAASAPRTLTRPQHPAETSDSTALIRIGTDIHGTRRSPA